MTRTLLLCTVLLAGCDRLFGTVEDRQACTASAECPAGQYCADTGSSRICWADAAAPVVAGVTAACPTAPCLRDSVLTVEATVTDDQELGPVSVSLDLDGGAVEVPMAAVSGALHRATLDLSQWPLPGLSATVIATVRAADGARNEASAQAPAGQRPLVTRVRGAVALATGEVVLPTAPALLPDGTVLVGGSTGRLYALAPGAAVPAPSGAALGAAVVHPPAVGQGAVWVAAGSRLFAVSPSLATVLNGAGYDAGGAIAGPPAVTAAAPTAAAPEVAFVASAGGRMAAVKAEAVANGVLDITRIIDTFTSGPALFSDADLFAVTATSAPATATLRQLNFDGALGEGPTRSLGQAVATPIAVTDEGAKWVATSEFATSTLHLTNPDNTPGPSIPLGANPGGSPVVLSNGDVAICVGSELRRFTAAGAPVWTAPLTGPGLTPLVLAEPGGATALLVPTRSGTVDLVDGASGARRWTVSLTVNVELREGTVRAAAGARASTAWFTSVDGLLHGLVVDGALDGAAPWPKAWHDARNTGNLAAPH